MLCFLSVLFIIQTTLVLKKNIKFFFHSVVNFPDNYQRYPDNYQLPFLLLETPGFSELLWTPTPGPPLRLCPGDLTAPPDRQLARAMTFACRHNIIKNPTNFWWWWWWWFEGGSHEIFTNREGGSTIFLLLPGGESKLLQSLSSHFYHTPPPRELKNDNSLSIVESFTFFGVISPLR